LLDTHRRIASCNGAALRLFGYKELEGKSTRVVHPSAKDFRAYGTAAYSAILKENVYRTELELLHKEGHVFPVETVLSGVRDKDGEIVGYVAIVRDITQRKQAEKQIQASLKEKEVLLKEIHHRVKNNLQIISSLLYLQAGKTEDPGAIRALKDSQNRVRSIALVHESLYQSSNLAGIQIGEYTRGVASNLLESYGGRDRPVRLTVRMGTIRLSINAAIPCGLIINELISNSLKHAFPEGREGEIRIELARTDTGSLALTVSDDGIGIPEHVDFRSSPSLGLTLVSSLVAQLGGIIELDRRGGTTFTITFDNPD
jgi:PAS domain S-box-containing protein